MEGQDVQVEIWSDVVCPWCAIGKRRFEAEAAAVLDSDAYTAEVRADEAEARALGIRGVPFFVIDRKYGVSGAQPAEALLDVLRKAWAEARPRTVVATGEAGQPCPDDRCAV